MEILLIVIISIFVITALLCFGIGAISFWAAFVSNSVDGNGCCAGLMFGVLGLISLLVAAGLALLHQGVFN